MELCIALNQVKSPTNVGILIRSLVAFGGKRIVFIGYEKPWDFKKGSEAFSRKLEKTIEIIHITDEKEFFRWCVDEQLIPVALEISKSAISLSTFKIPSRVVFILGSEKTGLSAEFLSQCQYTTCIQQSGKVGSLNLAAAGSIACNAYSDKHLIPRAIEGTKFTGER